jgi:uncharacterized protein YndB with AHSA1/START domain
MTSPGAATFMANREVVLTRLINAPPENVYRAWTEPELLKKWFVPSPLMIAHVELDVRPGGNNVVVMRMPNGEEIPNRGVYLEVVKDKKLVFTDAFTSAWEPSGKPFMTVIVTFENEDGQTRYTVRVRHWSIEDRAAHERMGFYTGWDQLAAVASTL